MMPPCSEQRSYVDENKELQIFELQVVDESFNLIQQDCTVEFEKKTMRYVDFHVLPLLALLYSFALIDRINLGTARTAGMGDALGLDIGNRFSIVTCLYFIPYTLLQIPGNVVLRIIGAKRWLTISVVLWGIVELSMGFVRSWGYLVLCRVLLGAFEAAFFPALVFIVSTWQVYKRYEVQKRLAAMYLMSITIAGFSPILAYVFSLLDGKYGIAGWSWIFIIEGAITVFLGVLGYFFLPDFPDRNTFLTKEQTELVLRRVEEDRGGSLPDPLTVSKVFHYMKDWTPWAYGAMFASASLPSYMAAYFISIILKGMNYSTTASLLLSAPPYGPAFISALFFAWWSDKIKHRASFIVCQALLTITGCSLTAFSTRDTVRYFGTFLINAGSSGCIPTILAYASNNVVSQSKRSVQTAMTILCGGIGGILASTVFREQDYPRYIPGLWVTIGSQILIIVIVATTTLHFNHLNRLSKEGKLKAPLEGRQGFLYTL